MNRSTANWIMNTIQCRHCYRRVVPSEVGSDYLCRSCHALAQLFPAGERNRRCRGHDFLNATMLRTIPVLYATEETPLAEKTIYAHYFVGACDWYVSELDPTTGQAFGYADLGMGCPEWGYFDLVEMEETVVNGWVVIERDLDFAPARARELGIA